PRLLPGGGENLMQRAIEFELLRLAADGDVRAIARPAHDAAPGEIAATALAGHFADDEPVRREAELAVDAGERERSFGRPDRGIDKAKREVVRQLGIAALLRDVLAGVFSPDVAVDVELSAEADFLEPVAAILRQRVEEVLVDGNIARG